MCFAILSLFTVHAECARLHCREHGLPPIEASSDEIFLLESVRVLQPNLTPISPEELSFTHCFPIYIFQDCIESFEGTYGSHNNRSLAAIQEFMKDVVRLAPFCWLFYPDDIIFQSNIPLNFQDVLWVPGLERSLLLLQQYYREEVEFHEVVLPAVNRGSLAVDLLLGLISSYVSDIVRTSIFICPFKY